jgi:2-oxoacid:acceptor oxidoreductase gamma subunit (pyruvate/2-ketoisovalerate family)
MKKDSKEIRFHGRGGQGVVVASEILVAAFLQDGKFGQSFPFFGVERRGAPVAAFVRCSNHQIWEKTQVYTPDCLVLMDLRLLKAVDVFAGVKDGATLVVNSEILELDNVPKQISAIGKVNATRIAVDCLGTPIVSTCILGAFAAATGWVSLNAVLKGVEQILPKEFAKANQKAVRRAFAETCIQRRGHEKDQIKR